jgi:hypothetical protein
MNKISEMILNKIKEQKITPIPRWRFIALHILLLIALVVSIALGAMAFGLILRTIGDVDWEIVGRAGRGPVRGLFLILPYIWFAFLGVVLYLSGKLFSITKTGYRYKPYMFVLLSIALSLISGSILYFAGAAHFIENRLADNVKPYARWMEKNEQMLVVPDQGTLAGMITSVNEKSELMIVDFMKHEWTVDISKAVYKKDFKPQVGRPVGVIGDKTGENTFRADKIMPWRPNNPPPIFKGMQVPPPLPLENLPPVTDNTLPTD